MGTPENGEAGTLPVLVSTPDISSVRLHPGQTKNVIIVSLPEQAWATLVEFRAKVVSEDENLTGDVVQGNDQASVRVSFANANYDDEDYPGLGRT